MQGNKPRQTCPECGITKGIRTFCRPKLQVQKVCNACWIKRKAATPKLLHNAITNNQIHATLSGRLMRALNATRAETLARESVRKSDSMKAYWDEYRRAKKREKN